MEDEKEQLQKRIDRMQKKVSPKLIVCYQVNMSFLVIIIIALSSTLMNQGEFHQKNVHITEINHLKYTERF